MVLQLNERGSRQSCLDGGSGGDLLAYLCIVLFKLYNISYARIPKCHPGFDHQLVHYIVPLTIARNIETLHAKKRDAIIERLSTEWIV